MNRARTTFGTSYATPLSYEDDGAGQIECPKKGLMGIQRCHEWQRETEAAGNACTCAVYHAYRGGEPSGGDGTMAPRERLCGRVFDVAVTEALAGRRAVPTTKEPPMPRTQARCTKCNKLPPDGTHNFGGLCKPCRQERRAAIVSASKAPKQKADAPAPAAEKPAPVETIESLVAKHLDHPATHAAEPPLSRQPMLPAVAEREISVLRGQLAEKDRELVELRHRLGRMAWIARGVRDGYAQLDRLSDLLIAAERN